MAPSEVDPQPEATPRRRERRRVWRIGRLGRLEGG